MKSRARLLLLPFLLAHAAIRISSIRHRHDPMPEIWVHPRLDPIALEETLRATDLRCVTYGYDASIVEAHHTAKEYGINYCPERGFKFKGAGHGLLR